ncbi:MAG: hypothetical protein KR126chlam2_00644 [Chlamydiae bacterium]|nr:hypothetical protein [Chlamydiota bacterium]
MSNYEIRTHYLLYSFFRNSHLDTQKEISKGNEASKLEMFVPAKAYIQGMAFESNEDCAMILDHSIIGLAQKGLLSSNYRCGSKNHVIKGYSKADSDGIVVVPTPLGAQMFLYVHGYGKIQSNKFCSSELNIQPIGDITLSETPRATRGG